MEIERKAMIPIDIYSNEILRTCCFTGHRPQKLTRSEPIIRAELQTKITAAIQEGYNTFITGMAYGVDIWAGEIVADLRLNNQNLQMIAAIPFPGFEKRWSTDWKHRFDRLLQQAEHICYICDRYSPASYQKRNEWMVNQSSMIIAVYNGVSGGTQNTIEYAKRKGVHIQLLNA